MEFSHYYRKNTLVVTYEVKKQLNLSATADFTVNSGQINRVPVSFRHSM